MGCAPSNIEDLPHSHELEEPSLMKSIISVLPTLGTSVDERTTMVDGAQSEVETLSMSVEPCICRMLHAKQRCKREMSGKQATGNTSKPEEDVMTVRQRISVGLGIIRKSTHISETAPDKMVDPSRFWKRYKKVPAVKAVLLKALKSSLFMSKASDDVLNDAVEWMKPHKKPANQVLIREGTEGNHFYVLASGTAESEVVHQDINIEVIPTGSTFGELSIMYNLPRQATVRSKTACVVCSLEAKQFRHICSKFRLSDEKKKAEAKQLLQGCGMFNDLFPAQIEALAEEMEAITVAAGQKIFQVGETGSVFYIVKSGRVQWNLSGGCNDDDEDELEALGHTPRAFENAQVAPGAYFGELAILSGDPRSADAHAVTDCDLYCISRDVFIKTLGPFRDRIAINTNLRILETLRIFQHIESGEKHFLAEQFEVDHFKAREVIFKQGEIGTRFYIVRKGQLRIEIGGARVRGLEPGDYFGELALINDEPRAATVIAVTDCSLFFLEKAVFDDAVAATDLKKMMTRYASVKDMTDVPTITPDQWKSTDFKKEFVVGVGHFSTVWAVRHKRSDERFALKVIRKKTVIDHGLLDNILREKQLFQNCDHPFIPRFWKSFHNKKYLCIVMALVSAGELFSLIHKPDRKFDGLTQEYARFVTASIVDVLVYLHSHSIAFRDLKPENIMVDENGYLKLLDFGFAKEIPIGSMSRTFCGTPEYMAPEVVLGRGHDIRVDYWGLGVLVYEMLTGRPPFEDLNNRDKTVICRNIVNGTIVFPFYLGMDGKTPIPKDAVALVRQLLSRSPEKRLGRGMSGPTALTKTPWLRSVDFAKLHRKEIVAPYSVQEDPGGVHRPSYYSVPNAMGNRGENRGGAGMRKRPSIGAVAQGVRYHKRGSSFDVVDDYKHKSKRVSARRASRASASSATLRKVGKVGKNKDGDSVDEDEESDWFDESDHDSDSDDSTESDDDSDSEFPVQDDDDDDEYDEDEEDESTDNDAVVKAMSSADHLMPENDMKRTFSPPPRWVELQKQKARKAKQAMSMRGIHGTSSSLGLRTTATHSVPLTDAAKRETVNIANSHAETESIWNEWAS